MRDYNGFSAAQRNRAQVWLNMRWRDGSLSRPRVCCACGQNEGIIDAHAEDYSEPFTAGKTDQYHLCYRCHMAVHCRHRNPVAWRTYHLAVFSLGTRFMPFYSRNFPRFRDEFNGMATPEIEEAGLPRDRDMLLEIVAHGRKFIHG